MPQPGGFFGPSDRALKFGAQYAEVLARWGDMFVSASKLVDANVQLGAMTSDAGKEVAPKIQADTAQSRSEIEQVMRDASYVEVKACTQSPRGPFGRRIERGN